MLTIKGKHHVLCRAVDQDGHPLDVLVQSKRNRQAANDFSQISQELALCAAGFDNRQAEELCSYQGSDHVGH
jgi:ribulose 1,5-bisphosphate carboxylase large subunit-like protein